MMFVMTIICTIVWQVFVTDRLYNCTDPGWLDFLFPGNWVHVHNNQPVAVVPVITGGSMSDPDTIKQGWSVARLWYVWFSFVFVSVLISVVLAWILWIPKQSIERINSTAVPEHPSPAEPEPQGK